MGPSGALDARLHGPPGGYPVLILHPHPRYGGTMGSRLVYDLAVALGSAGWRAVRFDFRGVGRSEGTYGAGLGEAADAVAVFDLLAHETGRRPHVIGYSFGGAVACHLATLRDVASLTLVGTPKHLAETSLDPVTDAPKRLGRGPVTSIVGDHDGFVPLPDAHALADAFLPPAKLVILPGAAHFLEPSYNPAAVAAVLEALSG